MKFGPSFGSSVEQVVWHKKETLLQTDLNSNLTSSTY